MLSATALFILISSMMISQFRSVQAVPSPMDFETLWECLRHSAPITNPAEEEFAHHLVYETICSVIILFLPPLLDPHFANLHSGFAQPIVGLAT